MGLQGEEVGRLASSFDTMPAVLYEPLTAQRQLVADASHELRTPLTSLTTNLDLLEDGAGVADPQAPALVRAAREQAGELDRLITDLLDLARYHESAPHRETVRLDLLTSEAVHRVRQRTQHAAIAADLQPCLVQVDPAGVDHAICNLIDNAIKWNSPDGAVHVDVADACVSVTDHGPGIADQDLPASSSASTGHPPHEACPARVSDWPSCPHRTDNDASSRRANRPGRVDIHHRIPSRPARRGSHAPRARIGASRRRPQAARQPRPASCRSCIQCRPGSPRRRGSGGHRLRQAGGLAVPGRVQDSSGTVRCSRTQLDLMGHDPEPALRWPGILRDDGRHTDRARYSRGGKWRNSRPLAIPMGRNGLTVKPSA